MTIDRNPSFGVDSIKEKQAHQVTDMLWSLSRGDLSKVPQPYLDSLSFEYSDGSVSLLDQLSKVEFSEGATHEDFQSVVNSLIKVDPQSWPFSESILSIQPDKLVNDTYPSYSESLEQPWDFSSPEDMSKKVELFLKKVISSVYLDGVRAVTDSEGNPPNLNNNYLMSDDGSFSGVFYDSDPNEDKSFPFEIKEKSDGNYEISY